MNRLTSGLSASSLLFAATTAWGITANPANEVAIPNARATTEGNLNNYFPFGDSQVSFRYQQVYDAAGFPSTNGPLTIGAMKFRPDRDYYLPMALTLDDVQINLSTTVVAPDAMAYAFAANTGSDEQLVYSGQLQLTSSSVGPLGGPKEFDVVLRFQTPFVYDPAMGNLLFDVRTFGNREFDSIIEIFDAENTLGDEVSRRWGAPAEAEFAEGPGGDPFPSLGLVTKFVFIPEPSASGLAFIASAIALRVGRGKRRIQFRAG